MINPLIYEGLISSQKINWEVNMDMHTLGHDAWVEAYFRPRPDSADSILARRMPCVCDDCESSRTRNRLFRGE